MTAKEAAEILGCHINTITNYIKQGKLKVLQHKGTRVDIDPFSVFEILKPEQLSKLKEKIKIDKHKAWYRKYMKEYSKEYDKKPRRQKSKNNNKVEYYVDENGKLKSRSIRGLQEKSLAQRLKMIGELEEYIEEEGLKHLTFQQLCKLYGFKELAEKYAKLKYRDSKLANKLRQLPTRPLYLLDHKATMKTHLIEAIEELEKLRGVRLMFYKKYTPEELYKKIQQYFKENDTIVEEIWHPRDKEYKLMKRKVIWNWAGLAAYLGVSQAMLKKYRTDENYSDYHDIMEWCANMIEARMIEHGMAGIADSKLVQFVMKNLNNDPHIYADKVVVQRNDMKHTKIEVEFVSGGQKQLSQNDIKMLEEESNKNKESLGINIQKAIEAYEKQKQKEETIDVAFTTEENNNKQQSKQED